MVDWKFQRDYLVKARSGPAGPELLANYKNKLYKFLPVISSVARGTHSGLNTSGGATIFAASVHLLLRYYEGRIFMRGGIHQNYYNLLAQGRAGNQLGVQVMAPTITSGPRCAYNVASNRSIQRPQSNTAQRRGAFARTDRIVTLCNNLRQQNSVIRVRECYRRIPDDSPSLNRIALMYYSTDSVPTCRCIYSPVFFRGKSSVCFPFTRISPLNRVLSQCALRGIS